MDDQADNGSHPRKGMVLSWRNDTERHDVAEVCVTKLALKGIRAVVDKIDDKVNKAYGALPDRLYLVGQNGRIAYAGERGPQGFSPDELEDAIKKELAPKKKSDDSGK